MYDELEQALLSIGENLAVRGIDPDAVSHLTAMLRSHGEECEVLTEERDAALLEVERLRDELRDKTNDLLDIRGILSPNGEARKVPMPIGDQVAPAVEWLVAEVERLTREHNALVLDFADEVKDRQAAEAAIERVRALAEAWKTPGNTFYGPGYASVLEAEVRPWLGQAVSEALDSASAVQP